MAYMKTNCRAYRLQLNREHDKDIIALLEQQENVNGFLKMLIRKEMKGMTMNDLLENIDLTETTVNVYRNGKKVDIDIMRDNDYKVERIYGGNKYEINVDIEGETK